jgi:hypothetical protein
MSAADRILVAIPARGREWWNNCSGCVFAGEPRRCIQHDQALRSLRKQGCKPTQRWIEWKG